MRRQTIAPLRKSDSIVREIAMLHIACWKRLSFKQMPVLNGSRRSLEPAPRAFDRFTPELCNYRFTHQTKQKYRLRFQHVLGAEPVMPRNPEAVFLADQQASRQCTHQTGRQTFLNTGQKNTEKLGKLMPLPSLYPLARALATILPREVGYTLLLRSFGEEAWLSILSYHCDSCAGSKEPA